MEKDKIKKILINMRTLDNEKNVDYLLKSLDEISDEELQKKLEQMNIFEDNIEQFLASLIEKNRNQEDASEKFIKVNDWFCYGRTGNTIHMHIIPKDLRGVKKELGDESFYRLYGELLENFLSKIQIIISEDPTINSLFAVSPMFYNSNISLIHESLGFHKIVEIDLNNANDKMSIEQKEFFLNMFNKGEKNKRVYYTKMTREELLEKEYSQINKEKPHLKH